jgi:hypothetical protein
MGILRCAQTKKQQRVLYKSSSVSTVQTVELSEPQSAFIRSKLRDRRVPAGVDDVVFIQEKSVVVRK